MPVQRGDGMVEDGLPTMGDTPAGPDDDVAVHGVDGPRHGRRHPWAIPRGPLVPRGVGW